ncbi:sirohydrochlorin chelatase [Halobacillus seohaensis]|uniref:Sirohydrochlorin chelatase n=1 Tax=Halobacillus seohaensis TaxID=447421 RepID=A0ABW2EM93_9BACI
MQAVLYVSHGSRVEKARKEAVTFIQTVQQQVDIPLQETCFLELAEPDVTQGISRLVDRGATKIVIMPVLLLSAGHYYKDIPSEIEDAKVRHPHINFVYGEPLGVQDRLVDILVQRIQETNVTRLPNAHILLVGRGSRNPETKQSIELIAQKLQGKVTGSTVDVCYLAACSPSFEEGLQGIKGKKQTFVIPYLWFTGVLMNSMQKKINEVKQLEQQVILCQYLGHHPFIIDALKDRVYEALESNSYSV